MPCIRPEYKSKRRCCAWRSPRLQPLKIVDKQNVVHKKSPESKHNAAVAAEIPPTVIEMEPEPVAEKVANSGPEINPPWQDERKALKIVFTVEEVNKKYLNKSAVAEATSPANETSTIQKLLDKAYDLKHNQDPLGELRQKKNEILALNFGGERQRTDN